jgi:hypothetical protein
MTRRAGILGGVLGLLFAGLQVVPVERTNPPVESDVAAPPPVHTVLRRACYDCHSNETAWPWYSHVAPVSWLVTQDVQEGRGRLNFSTWNRLDAKRQVETRRKAWEEIAKGDMPLWFYTPLHSGARLSLEDKAILREWLEAARGAEPPRP